MSFRTRFAVAAAMVACLGVVTYAFGAENARDTAEKRTHVVTSHGKPLTLLGHEIKVGDKAPDFTVLNRELKPVSLHDFAGQVLIITVFPSIDTKVCSAQARRFNEEAAKLQHIQILTVSMDLPFALDRFCAADGIDKVMTLSDHRHADFGLKYGYLIKDMRLLARGTVIVDRKGVVRYVEFVPRLESEPDYAAAVAVAKKLAGQV